MWTVVTFLAVLLCIPVISAQHTVLCSTMASCEPIYCNKYNPDLNNVCRMARGLELDTTPPSIESVIFAIFVWVAAICLGLATLNSCCSLVVDDEPE